jgi:cell division protein FtsQ
VRLSAWVWRKKNQAAYRQSAACTPPAWQRPLIIFVSLLAGAVALWETGRWLLHPATFPVHQVTVSGFDDGHSVPLRHVQTRAVQSAVTELLPEGMLWLSPHALRSALENLPWVKHARVVRQWPDTVRIVLREYHAVARWHSLANRCQTQVFCWLLDSDGEIFYVMAMQIPAGLPILSGAHDSASLALHHYRTLEDSAAATGRHIRRLHLDTRQALSVELDNGLRLQLGLDNAAERLQRFFRVYPIIARDRENVQIHHIDLRYPNGIVVQWHTLDVNRD